MSQSINDVLLEVLSNTSIVNDGDTDENPKELCEDSSRNQNCDRPIKKFKKLDTLKLTRILKLSPENKLICVQCEYLDQPGIILIEKTSFEKDLIDPLINNFSEVLQNIKNLYRNDIFASYIVQMALQSTELNKELNKLNLTIIHPASQKDIEKYSDNEFFLVRESYDSYLKVTKPFIDNQVKNPRHLKWLYNILEHEAETDRIVYEENLDNKLGFILVKDMKWKCVKSTLNDIEKLEIYIIGFVVRRDLQSLRDLNEEHLPLLEAIYHRGKTAISKEFSISPEELRVFIHYQPSFYHLHVHFTHIKAKNGGFQCERAHLLSNVIENIRLVPDYYQRATLEFSLSAISELQPKQYE